MTLKKFCQDNNIRFIFSTLSHSDLEFCKDTFVDNKYDGYMKYDLVVIKKNPSIQLMKESINKLSINGFLYFEDMDPEYLQDYIKGKILQKDTNFDNIYKKIGNISNEVKKDTLYNGYTILIFDKKKYSLNVISKIFPIVKSDKYTIYSINMNGKVKETKFDFYPYYPVMKNNVLYVNPIHLQLIDLHNIKSSIMKNVKIMLTDNSSELPFSKYPKFNKTELLHLYVKNEALPYKENNHGWLSEGTKSSLYAVSKILSPKTIIEFGTWYGNSAEYIKKNNPENTRLICFDIFRNIFESEYTLHGYGVDKFYIKYPRLEAVYKRLQQFKNMELVKGDAYQGIDYLKKLKVKPDTIFIDFIKSEKLLMKFLSQIHSLFPKTIIIGDDYVFDTVKLGVKNFLKNNTTYTLITNENSYILIPKGFDSETIEEIRFSMNKEWKKLLDKKYSNKYYQVYELISKNKIEEAISMIKKENLKLNYSSKFLPNDGTLYHIFALNLKKSNFFNKYMNQLYSIELPEKVKNNFEFTFTDILKFDASRLTT